jgi:hypothetical protein
VSMADGVRRVEDVLFRVAGLVVAALLGLACQTTRDSALSPGPTTPASQGTVSAAADPNGNTELSVVVDHLPPPERLSPELRTFVVWIRPVGSSRYLNAGQLTIDDDRSGELETVTPHTDVEVLVTAEASGAPGYPSTYKILEGRAQR